MHDERPIPLGIEKIDTTAKTIMKGRMVTSPAHSPASLSASAEHEQLASEPPVRWPVHSSRSPLRPVSCIP